MFFLVHLTLKHRFKCIRCKSIKILQCDALIMANEIFVFSSDGNRCADSSLNLPLTADANCDQVFSHKYLLMQSFFNFPLMADDVFSTRRTFHLKN
jgi:hypothetical protein